MENGAAKRPGGASRLTARVLVALALLGSLFAVGSVVAGTLGGGSGEGEQTQQRSGPADRGKAEQQRERKRPPREYVVEAGDTLSGIAEKLGVPVKRLQRLNPDLDPQALATGQVLRLR